MKTKEEKFVRKNHKDLYYVAGIDEDGKECLRPCKYADWDRKTFNPNEEKVAVAIVEVQRQKRHYLLESLNDENTVYKGTLLKYYRHLSFGLSQRELFQSQNGWAILIGESRFDLAGVCGKIAEIVYPEYGCPIIQTDCGKIWFLDTCDKKVERASPEDIEYFEASKRINVSKPSLKPKGGFEEKKSNLIRTKVRWRPGALEIMKPLGEDSLTEEWQPVADYSCDPGDRYCHCQVCNGGGYYKHDMILTEIDGRFFIFKSSFRRGECDIWSENEALEVTPIHDPIETPNGDVVRSVMITSPSDLYRTDARALTFCKCLNGVYISLRTIR